MLVRRYLEGFGPASMADIGTFTFLRRPAVRQAIAALGHDVVGLEGPDGVELFDVPGGEVPSARTKAPPRLLDMWDNVLLAYADRRRIVPDEYRALVIRRNGDVLATMLVDGYVAGVWRSRDGSIEMTAFHELPATTWRALSDQARQLGAFLAGRDPRVYRRYDHWWDDLPAAEVRHIDIP